jgi:DNA-binding transcriptional ArsR family regulator
MMTIDRTALDGLTEIFRVLGDPTRLRILDALSRAELCVGDLAAQLGATESAVSHQLRLLRSARIVRARREGRMIFYTLDDTHVLTLFEQGLRHVQEARHVPRNTNGGLTPPKPDSEKSRDATPASGGRSVPPKLPVEDASEEKPSSGGRPVPPKLPTKDAPAAKSSSGGGR